MYTPVIALQFFDYNIPQKKEQNIQSQIYIRSPFINVGRGSIEVVQQQVEVVQHGHLHQPLIDHQVIASRTRSRRVEVRGEDVVAVASHLVVASDDQARARGHRVVLAADDVGVGLELLGLGQPLEEVVRGPCLGVVVEAVLHGRSVGRAEVGLESINRSLRLVDDDGVHRNPRNVDDCRAAAYDQQQKKRGQIEVHHWKIIIPISIIAF